jgi:hypothetical protein
MEGKRDRTAGYTPIKSFRGGCAIALWHRIPEITLRSNVPISPLNAAISLSIGYNMEISHMAMVQMPIFGNQ